MTVTDAPADAPAAPGAPGPAPWWSRDRLEHAAVVAALVWWAGPLTHRLGGRGPGAVSVGLLLLLPALALSRPWARLPAAVVGLAGTLGAAAVAVCLVTPTGWYGGNDAAAYGYAAGLGVVVLAYCRTPGRRLVVVTAVCGAGLVEAGWAFLPWWGSGHPDSALVGTFYWWNPFAAYLLAPALLGLAVAVWGVRPIAALGWAGTVVCSAAIVLSTSRASMTCLAAAWLLVGLGSLRSGGRRARLVRFAGAGALTVALLVFVTGPPVFAHRASPLSATSSRTSGAGQDFATSGGARLDFWQEAVSVFDHHPWAGGGYHSLAAAGQLTTPFGWPRSNLAHNGYLQSLSDGGLLLGVPFLLLLALGGLAAGAVGAREVVGEERVRSLLRAAEAREPGEPAHGEAWLRVAAPAAAAALLVHSAVDFDWSHPSDLAGTAVALALAGSLLGPSLRDDDVDAAPAWARRTLAGCLAVVLALASLVAYEWDHVGAEVAQAQLRPAPAAKIAALSALATRPFADLRVDEALLRDALPAALRGPLAGSPAEIQAALRRTAAAAAQDRRLLLLRARVQVLGGQQATALLTVGRLIGQLGGGVGPYTRDIALVLLGAGQTGWAHNLELPFVTSARTVLIGWGRAAELDQLFGPADLLTRCASRHAMTLGPAPAGYGPFPAGTAAECSALVGTAL